MKIWNFRGSTVCPLYDAPEVIRCRSKIANDRWTSSIDALEDQLLNDGTPTNTVNIIVNQLHSWKINSYEIPTHTATSLSSAVISHNLVGWQVFIQEYMSIE